MTDVPLVERLSKLVNLPSLPQQELDWLVAHGKVEIRRAGEDVILKGILYDSLYIVLSGSLAVRVDRGAGPRIVVRWTDGDPTGMLPYSRMKSSPGNNYAEVETELLSIHESLFPELTHKCPVFTAHTVHMMLDRARSFRTGDLQDEKMLSLGKLAAGLAHELNNPASAILRGSKQLLENQNDADAAARALGASGLSSDLYDTLVRFRNDSVSYKKEQRVSPLDKMDLEEDIADWLEVRQLDTAPAESLAENCVRIESLNSLFEEIPVEAFESAIRWIAISFTTHSLSSELEEAASRIYELVAAVKKFSYMDNLTVSESVEVESGIRDTLSVLAAKVKSRSASIEFDIDNELPHVNAKGVELNQVWMNLLDNALDAIGETGNIEIIARKESGGVVVHIVDNGHGIPEDSISRVFDPFFTTKPPGKGIGLGLEIALRIVRRHHGEISVQSQPGRTEFRVSLLATKAG
jgi:signal transduction histidine kinase